MIARTVKRFAFFRRRFRVVLTPPIKIKKTDVILKKTKEFQKEVCDLVNSVAPNTLDGGGWEVICAEKGKDHVYYRREENDTKNDDKVSGKMSFRVEGFVEAPLLNLASLIYELDMWPKWFPGMIKARTHATISKFRLVPVMESWLPCTFFSPSLLKIQQTKIKTTRAHGKPSLEVICIW